jgi:hypothetical protein
VASASCHHVFPHAIFGPRREAVRGDSGAGHLFSVASATHLSAAGEATPYSAGPPPAFAQASPSGLSSSGPASEPMQYSKPSKFLPGDFMRGSHVEIVPQMTLAV